MSSKQYNTEKDITRCLITYFCEKILFKCFAKELERKDIVSQITDPLVCVTPAFKSQPQKFGTSCNDILNVLVTAKKTHWRNWSPHHPHLSTSALSGNQHILNSAREARWFVSRWKKWNHVSGLKSLPLHLIGPFSLCKEYAPLPVASFVGFCSLLKIPRCTGIGVFLTPLCLAPHFSRICSEYGALKCEMGEGEWEREVEYS